MCPILSDLQEQARENREAKHGERQRATSAAAKPLSKNAYRKQQRRMASHEEAPDTAIGEVATETKRSCNCSKQATPTVAVLAPTPTLGAYLPSVQVLCAISLLVGIILLIRNK